MTNKHVLIDCVTPCVRFNNTAGDTTIVETSVHDWFHSASDDLSVLSIFGLSNKDFKFRFISEELFLTKQIVEDWDIGPGDDTYLVRRFLNHEGKQQNLPTLRFGNISMNPIEAIRHPLGHDQESFLVESRSISGYSGSPVFVYRSPFQQRGKQPPGVPGSWLLGVDWGHLKMPELVTTQAGDEVQVATNTGMMTVVPAWRLRALLYEVALTTQREQHDKAITNTEPSQ